MGPPQVPTPLSRRGRMLARQRIDDAIGRFGERIQDFPFDPIAPATTVDAPQSPFTVTSLGGRFVRCTALKGVTASSAAFNGTELAALRLRIELNGQSSFIGGNGTNFASFAALFASQRAPWFWFLSPALFRAGDKLRITVANTDAARTLTPEVSLRLIDDTLWQELYSRDWLAETGGL